MWKRCRCERVVAWEELRHHEDERAVGAVGMPEPGAVAGVVPASDRKRPMRRAALIPLRESGRS